MKCVWGESKCLIYGVPVFKELIPDRSVMAISVLEAFLLCVSGGLRFLKFDLCIKVGLLYLNNSVSLR